MGSDGIGRVSAADSRFTRSGPEFNSQHREDAAAMGQPISIQDRMTLLRTHPTSIQRQKVTRLADHFLHVLVNHSQ